jgi:leader peptidase (prepilin peptidase)/N-methyltransferase
MSALLASNLFDARSWGLVPPDFWSAVFFVFGAIVGSFLNVCIHRLPRGESVLRPGSHCPQCRRPIPWRLNLPLVTWLWLRGRCAFCQARIPARYFVVELLTALAFTAGWMAFGETSAALALFNCLVLAGLITATLIDWEHFIIPDQITIGGIVAGVLGSFLLPELQRTDSPATALQRALIGAAVGGGVIYTVVRVGKFFLGRHTFTLAPGTRIHFAETSLAFPDHDIPYEELLYRRSDSIQLAARTVEMVDRCYRDVAVEVSRRRVKIGEDEFAFDDMPGFEVVADHVILPREVMGLGDVKFMAAIGAVMGWQAVVFCLTASALIGAVVGLTLIALRRHARSAPMPYWPFIAAAAVIWIFAGRQIVAWWFGS